MSTRRYLREQVLKVLPLRIEEFSRHGEILQAGVHVFPEIISIEDWFQDFTEKIFRAITNRYFLPVFRMSHGEFHFALGSRMCPEGSFKVRLWMLKKILKERLGIGAFLQEFSPQSGTSEVLSKAEYLSIRQRVIDDLRWIAERGFLCACFHRSPGYIEYLPSIIDWMETNKIPLHSRNYFHFYFVYALIFGSHQSRLFRNRKIAVVTSFPGDKRQRLEQALLALGADRLSCVEISPGRALFDRVNPAAIPADTDLALVGAGVGATNILRQLESCSCPVMDVGFAIDALANPNLKFTRPFCTTNKEWDINKISFKPTYNAIRYKVENQFIHKW